MTDAALSPMNSTTDRARPFPVPGWLRASMRVMSTVAPGLAALVAKRLFFVPRRARIRAREHEVLAHARTFSLSVLDQRIPVYVWGDGPTILLVHGWGGHAGHLAGFVDPLVTAGFRVVAADLPGHGQSDGRVSSLVHVATAVEELDGLFRPLSGVVAHSFGAAGMTYAMSRGVAVERAVYVAPAARFEPYWERFRDGVGISAEVMDRFLQNAERWLDVRFEGMAAADLAPTMTTPLLVIHGTNDREVGLEEGALIAERWPGAVLRTADGLSHNRVLWDPESIAAAVQFLGERAPTPVRA